ncbi:MAG: AAA family ATPase, partial [Candidatus Thorarchaeota archaeon]
MTRLVRMRLQDFRSFASIDVELDDLTVLVGPNASGKSNLVDGIRFISDAFRRGLELAFDDRGGYSSVVRRRAGRGRPKDMTLTYYLTSDKFPGDTFEYQVTIGAVADFGFQVKEEYLVQIHSDSTRTEHLMNKNGRLRVGTPEIDIDAPRDRLALPLLDNYTPFDLVYDFFVNAGFYTIYPDHLRSPQKPMQGYQLAKGGENLASVIKRMSTGDDDLMEDLVSDLAKIVPDITKLEVRRWGGFYAIRLLHGKGSDAVWFDMSMESDGTIRALALLTAIYTTPSGTLLALEEPELTIHPGATKVIAEALKEAADRYQVIVTTHSPDLLDEFRPEDVLV